MNPTMQIDRKNPEHNLWRTGLLPRCWHGRSRVVATLDNGRQGRRLQCCDCGKLETSPLKIADFPDAAPVDAEARASWDAQRKAAGETAQAEARKKMAMKQAAIPLDEADFWRDYTIVLKSPAWKVRRAIVLRRDHHQCTAGFAGCTFTAYEVHHLGRDAYRYQRKIGECPNFLLTSLCSSCHSKITLCDRASRGNETTTPQPDPNDTLLEDLPF